MNLKKLGGAILLSTFLAGTAMAQTMQTTNPAATAKTVVAAPKAVATKVAKAPSAAQLAQRQKMSACNATAKTQMLKGAARKTFMSTCLKK